MNFFDDVGSSSFAQHMYPDSFADDLTNSSFWNDPPPPDFMGITTSFVQQPLQYMPSEMQSLSYHQNQLTGHINNHLTETPSADVLAGAAALIQNGNHQRTQTDSTEPMFGNVVNMLPHRNHTVQTMPSFAPNSTNVRHDPFFMFNAQQQSTIPKHPTKNTNMNWGSDLSFAGAHGFVAPPNQEDKSVMEQRQLGLLDCFEPRNLSAPSTNPSSPILSRSAETQNRRPLERITHPKEELFEPARPRKPSRIEELILEQEDDAGVDVKPTLKKRRPKSMAAHIASTSQSPPPSSKRRKSTASSATRLVRENLTENQKRENHIKSEQKRRTLIKEGFDDLNELVPDLRSGGFSKSVVLTMAADFLDDLVKENNKLKMRIAKLENRHGS